MNTSPEFLDQLMQAALEQAALAAEAEEVPVGAVISHNDQIIARAHNEVESRNDASAHAEQLAIRAASEKLGNWRLTECILCVTLEPCTMCAGAIKLARLPVVVFGAHDDRMGACGSLFDLFQDKRLGPVPRVVSGIREDECVEILQSFFAEKRSSS